jgi:hypothetical protein
MKQTLSSTLANLLAKFGGKNWKNYTLKGALDLISADLDELKKDLNGPDKMMATKFFNKCKKCKEMAELLTLISETMLALSNLTVD